MVGRGCRCALAAIFARTALCAGADDGASCEESEESGLLSLRRTTLSRDARLAAMPGLPPFGPDCLQVSVSFPKCFAEDSCLTYTSLRYTIVDTDTLVVQPILVNDLGDTIDLQPVYNGYETPTTGNNNIGRDQYSVYFRNDAEQMEDFLSGTTSFTVKAVPAVAAFIRVDAFYEKQNQIGYRTTQLNFTNAGNPVFNPYGKGNPNIKTLWNTWPCTGARGVDWSKVHNDEPTKGTSNSDANGAGSEDLIANFRAAAGNPADFEAEFEKMVADSHGEALIQDAGAAVANTSWSKCLCGKTNTNVFRMSVDLSRQIQTQGSGPDDLCSITYLYSPAITAGVVFGQQTGSMVPLMSSYTFKFGYIKIKIPRTFDPSVAGNFPGLFSDTNTDGYDANAWTVSSNWLLPPDPNVPFTVNSLMLKEEGFHTDEGEGYVLFAPAEDVQEMLPANPSVPPVVTLSSGLKAYVLAAPEFLWIFRYRDVSFEWKGSTVNAPCEETLDESLGKPVTCQDLGDYTPQIQRVTKARCVRDVIRKIRKQHHV